MGDPFDTFPGDELLPPDPEAGAAPGETDLPADFFDDVAEEAPVAESPEEPVPVAAVNPFETTAHPPRATFAAEAPAPAPAESGASRLFPSLMGAAFLATMVAGVVYARRGDAPAAAPAPAAAAAPAPTPAAPPEPSPVEALGAQVATEIKRVDTQLAEAAAAIKALQGRLDALPKSDPAAELKPVVTKLEELSKSVASLAKLPATVAAADEKVGNLDDEIKTVRDEMSGLKDGIKKAADEAAAAKAATAKLAAAAAAPPANAAPAAGTPAAETTAAADTPKPPGAPRAPEPNPKPDDATSVRQGAELFKAGRYAEALDLLKKAETAGTKDARVYYYAALASGLTAGWQGESVRLVTEGARLEKSGATKKADVDATFGDLDPQLKNWLTYYRNQ